MSDFKVEVVKIDEVFKHPNADRLDIVKIKGWSCVVAKDSMKTGDKAIYIPIDSILPMEVETKIFGVDSKVKLSKHRVRTIKLRSAISQGLCVAPEVLGFTPFSLRVGDELTEELGITKFEPAQSSNPQMRGNAAGKKSGKNPNFHKYGGIDNFKNYPTLFEDGDEVIITEKIHGTHFRCGWVPSYANTIWQKIQKFFGILPKYQFVYGSNNVQLQNKLLYKGFYEKNVYAKIVQLYDLKTKLGQGEVLHGEIYGHGIQKNYEYGLPHGEHKLVVFDLKWTEENTGESYFIPQNGTRMQCIYKGLPFVPVLYEGAYNAELVEELVKGPSVLDPGTPVREGIVIQAADPEDSKKCILGRKMLKRINDTYLLDSSNTDFH